MEASDIINVAVPLCTFVLGVTTTPWIESLKARRASKILQENLMIEIKDELEALSKYLEKMAKTLITLNSFKDGVFFEGSIKYVPPRTDLYFLKETTLSSFRELNSAQRRAVKILFTQIGGLDKQLDEIRNTKASGETIDVCILNCKNYLYTGCCAFNTMRVLARHPGAITAESDEVIINSVFEELQIGIGFDSITVTTEVTF